MGSKLPQRLKTNKGGINANAGLLGHARDHLHSHHRVSPQVEEIVVYTNMLYGENVAPDICQYVLDEGTRGDKGL